MINYKEEKDILFIENNKYFNPDLIFDCGQSFRFFEKDGLTVRGVAFNSIIEITKTKNGFFVTSTPSLPKEVLTDFFDLKRDYGKIENTLSKDDVMREAMKFGQGIRILKQDFFEMLLTFIYSQQSNIPRISKCVEKTAELFGTPIEHNGKTYYTFPTPKQLENITVSDLEPVKCGYRAAYIVDAVEKVLNGELNYDVLKNLPYHEVKKKLLNVRGIGEKVADCICLFAFGFFEAFPTDTWIKKAMDSLYGIEPSKIKDFSENLFGDLSGIAQQYLFYYLRYKK